MPADHGAIIPRTLPRKQRNQLVISLLRILAEIHSIRSGNACETEWDLVVNNLSDLLYPG